MDPEIDAALAAVGPHLRALRQDRGLTLAELATATGISVSTLSRLEAGRRRPNLELLLPVARALEVAVDDLVGSGATTDPRVRGRPSHQEGRTSIPLSRHAEGIQAYKLVLRPPRRPEVPDLQVHDGYEWLYVLVGRLRLVVGEHDLELAPGEVAEFDTRVPHWLGAVGEATVELLGLFGPQGERLHVRARPRPVPRR